MTIRTTHKHVVFAHPFQIEASDAPLPAGAYSVRTDEETLQGETFQAYRWLCATLRSLNAPRAERADAGYAITPLELHAALKTDAEHARLAAYKFSHSS